MYIVNVMIWYLTTVPVSISIEASRWLDIILRVFFARKNSLFLN